jgi:hypothetical protein
MARVAGARLPYAKNLVSGTPMHWHAGHITVCARPVPAYRVHSYGEGGRQESERRPECRETVPDTTGGRRPLFVVTRRGADGGCAGAWPRG